MPTIQQRTNRFRQELADRETAATAEMTRAYTRSWEAIYEELRTLSIRVAAAEQRGEFSPSWIYQELRLRSFAQTVTSEISKLTGTAQGALSGLSTDFVGKAEDHTRELITALMGRVPEGAIPSFTRLNPGVLESIVAQSGPGSPVAALFDAMPAGTAERISAKLTNGLALGKGMEEVAREVRPEVGGDLVRSVAIVRTESLRAYRSAAIENYAHNSDVVKGWQWSAQLSRRTCPVCIAMHGSIHPLEEPFGSHVNCRCVPIPYTASWAELGFDDIEEAVPEMQSGADWFGVQANATQQAILGPGKFDLYTSGEIDLPDVIGYRVNPVWGETRYERSIKDIQENGAKPVGISPINPIGVRPERLFPAPKLIDPVPVPAVVKKPRKPRTPKAPTPAPEQKPELTAEEARAAIQRIADEELQKAIAESDLSKVTDRYIQAETQRRIREEVLFQQEAATIKVKWRGIPAAQKEGFKEAVTIFQWLIGKASGVDGQEVLIKSTARSRSFYDNFGSVAMSGYASPKIVTHELGHWLEQKSADIHADILDFFARRTAGEKLELMSKITGNANYKSYEKAYKDNFINAYMGKLYESGGRQYATEILSMGLEYFHDNPVELAETDPDFFDFIYNVVRRAK